MTRRSGYIIGIGLGALVVAALFTPQSRQIWHDLRGNEVGVPLTADSGTALPEPTLGLEADTSPAAAKATARPGQTLAREAEVSSAAPQATASPGEALNLEIITILGKDAIPAILDPQFLSAAEAAGQMVATERVLGVSINGDHRAYPLNQLSRHEIVNDEVGGVPVAVTW